MAKVGGKGRISNELVATSCAAVLAVYAAGYWRTRDDARRMDVRLPERTTRPSAAPAETLTAATPAAQDSSAPAPEAPRVTSAAPVAAAATPALTPAEPAPAIPPAEAPSPESPAQSTAAISPSSQIATPDDLAALPASTPIPDPLPSPSGNWRDGTYTGWGTSRHGDIKAQVVIRGGRIVEAGIASCETRYPCDVIGDIIPQPVARQSPDVDRVSRATESADAYYFGLVEALNEAQIPEAGGTTAPR